jgi:hypothetical protein
MEEIIEMVRKQAGERGFDMDVEDRDDGSRVCTFSEYGVKKNYRVTLLRL